MLSYPRSYERSSSTARSERRKDSLDLDRFLSSGESRGRSPWLTRAIYLYPIISPEWV